MTIKKKKSPFSPIAITLSFLVFLVPLILLVLRLLSFQSPQTSPIPTNPSKPPTKSSFSTLMSHPRPTTQNSQLTTLIAVGDIMLGRYCNVQMIKNKDWRFLFLKTADLTQSVDITFGNLESPIVENCPSTSTGMIFCARPESIEGLKFAGFDILSVANNHILNYGQKGLEQTVDLLAKNNIFPSQDNKITRYQVNNVIFDFLSFDLISNPLTNLSDRKFLSMAKLISSEAENVDILIVSLHWGNEYQKTPTEQQKQLAHQIIDSGAKVIIGHHPHVTQPVESYHDGLIFYSLGNFVFDQPWSEETKKGKIAEILFEGKNIKSYELTPIYIQNYCQPQSLQ